ncbi:MAG: GNAT family N-acetyltransferase [Hyphomicrobium sp.]
MQTRRLQFRPLTDDDAVRIADLAGQWEVASMTGRIPYPYSADDAQHWLTGLAEGEVVHGITHGGALIGICGYTADDEGTAEIGYWIGKPYWGKGFATEAASHLMAHGFTRGGIKRFTCCHFTENPASQRVIEKLGFRLLGHTAGWCAARGMDMPALKYERRRPFRAALKALAK